jgi:hypothetical protein
MNIDNILTGGFNIWVIVKIFSLILLGMYIVFAFGVVKQVKMMTTTLRLGNENFAKIISYVHLVAAFVVFLAALIIL